MKHLADEKVKMQNFGIECGKKLSPMPTPGAMYLIATNMVRACAGNRVGDDFFRRVFPAPAKRTWNYKSIMTDGVSTRFHVEVQSKSEPHTYCKSNLFLKHFFTKVSK